MAAAIFWFALAVLVIRLIKKGCFQGGKSLEGDIPLTEIKKFLHLTLVRTGYESCVIEITLALLAFLSQNVAVISMFSLDLPCAGEREALL